MSGLEQERFHSNMQLGPGFTGFEIGVAVDIEPLHVF
jgi:hypothetical protein